MTAFEKFQKHEAAFRENTRMWILAQDQMYRKIAATEVAGSKPIRHPRGQTHTRHTREYLWSDALWCGDRTSEPLELFFFDADDMIDGVSLDEIFESQGTDTEAGKIWEWSQLIFNEEFKKACPDIAHVLEG
jgi:hypothetical protein